MPSGFSFWNFGSVLQKSHKGLLRSLLFDLLSRHKHLILLVLPALCRAAVVREAFSEPTLRELSKAFNDLMTLQSSSFRLCIFIDDIDVYDVHHAELVYLFVSLKSPYVKLVLSSRPTSRCEAMFTQCPKFLLQDLKYDDIRIYANDRLQENLYMKELKEFEGGAVSSFIIEMTEKASSVFLWVRLVVSSLLDGLSRYDHVADLHQRLDELSAELEKLYQKMIDSMMASEREQASWILQIVLRSTEVQSGDPLSLLQLSCTDERNAEEAVQMPIKAITGMKRNFRCKAMEGKLKSRCCGQVEVSERDKKLRPDSAAAITYVSLMHRTVAEYLRIDSMWKGLVALIVQAAFDPYLALLSSYVSKLRPYLLSRQPFSIRTDLSSIRVR